MTSPPLAGPRELRTTLNSANASCIQFFHRTQMSKPLAFSRAITLKTYLKAVAALTRTDQEHEGGDILETTSLLLSLPPPNRTTDVGYFNYPHTPGSTSSSRTSPIFVQPEGTLTWGYLASAYT